MTKTLHHCSNSKIVTALMKQRLLTLILLLMGPASSLLLAQGAQSKVFGPPTLALSYDFDACRSFNNDNSPYEYHEFTSEEGTSCAAVWSGQLYRHNGKHSCTDDAYGNPGDAACFQSSKDVDYSADHTLAIRFDVTLSGLSNRSSRLDGISFQQLAPHNYLWSAEGYESSTGANNYPTKYGLRVLKDNVEIYRDEDRQTTQTWETDSFSFDTNENFQVEAGRTSVFTFELISYAPVGNGAMVSAWDLDNLKIFTACEIECNLTVAIGEDQTNCDNEAITITANTSGIADCSTLVSSYKIKDASTEGKSCFPTWGTGVIFQRAAGCQGSHDIWRAGDDLMLQEFSDDTAKITGSVIDQNGQVGIVDILLYDKAHSGTTWQASCYLEGLADDPRTFYHSFDGTITVNGEALTVTLKASEQHYILSDGAGFDPGQYGLGAWTGGTFGGCTEWFGSLEPKPLDIDDDSLTYLWSTGETTPSITVTESGEYSVTVKDCNGCTAMDTVNVHINSASAEASADETICKGESTTLRVSGEGTYLWSTGETSQMIDVSPEVTTTYTVTVTNGFCTDTDEVTVTVTDKIHIGDYVWLDENRNGIQDDGATGINNVSVALYQCNGDLVDRTTTSNDADGRAGYYQFEVCPNSGTYYVLFGAIPEGLQFTSAQVGGETIDSNPDTTGKTACFTISDANDLSIDAGLNEICDLTVDAGEAEQICTNSQHIVELTATIDDASGTCEAGCVYPILEQERCFGPTGTFEIWLNSKAGLSSWKFKASEQRFERLANGNARYTAQASNGVDNIAVDVTFSGYTTTPTLGSPKLNDCQDYDTSEWEYWTTWTGTISSENHGVFTVSMMGAPFQIGVGADVTRSGFGASGWFSTEGGDGYYTIGDINIPLGECQENGVEYKWTTTDGHIIGDPYQKTISIDAPGTYVFEAMNCIDCFATDKVVVKGVSCAKNSVSNSKKITTVYPVPVPSGGTLTMEFGSSTSDTGAKKTFGPELEEDIAVVVYDMNGRMISVPRSFKMIGGKAVIYLDIDSIPGGKYIVRAQGNNWAESKHILVR